MRKAWLLFILLLLTSFIVSACSGNNEETTDAETVAEAEEAPENEAEEPEETEANDQEKETEDTIADSDFSELISYMEEETEGNADVIFENEESQEHDLDGVTAKLESYTLVELEDFHTNFSIKFNDQTDGGVLLAQYTVENTTDDDVYYMPTFDMEIEGIQKYFSNYKDLIPEEEQLPSILSPSNDYLLEAGETVTGYVAYPLGQDILDEALDKSTVSIQVPVAFEEPGEFDKRIGKEGRFSLALNDEGSEKVSASGDFYEDKATFENMGEKEMIKEKEDIGESEELGDYTVELDGYQFTEFTPNEQEAPRFDNFDNGVVLLTVKFNLENNGDDNIGLFMTRATLSVNDGAQMMMNEGMLLDYGNEDFIEPGESGEFLQVFVLEKEQYDKIWKDKDFEIKFGPFKNEDAGDISKGKEAMFTLPK